MAGGVGDTNLEFTPTWVVAVVCTVIVVISLVVERVLHYFGKYLKKKKQKPLYEALQKIKEELMLVGFISLLLNLFQDSILKICISEDLASKWLPCKKEYESVSVAHFQYFSSFARHLLDDSSQSTSYCGQKGKVPLLSITALHHLHIFIFVLAVVHVVFSALTIVFGAAKMRQWKQWEDSVGKKEDNSQDENDVMVEEKRKGFSLSCSFVILITFSFICYSSALKSTYTVVQDDDFIKGRFLGMGKVAGLHGWVNSFLKQFYGSVTKSDYTTLRLGFIMTHCRSNPKFNFHKYMISALEADFKKVVGISWYLWIVVVVFLFLNVAGWHAYFWISFFPLLLLVAVGTKLEHIIIQLANEVAEKHAAIEGDVVITPSDDHFWFKKPRLVLFLIHIILFQNSFEIAIFLWILFQYKFNSCIMGKMCFAIPRIVIGVLVQVMCSYSTLPLYAIVAQMGNSFHKAIFDEPIQESIAGWARLAKKKVSRMTSGSNNHSTKPPSQIAPNDSEGSVSNSLPQSEATEIEVVTVTPQLAFKTEK